MSFGGPGGHIARAAVVSAAGMSRSEIADRVRVRRAKEDASQMHRLNGPLIQRSTGKSTR